MREREADTIGSWQRQSKTIGKMQIVVHNKINTLIHAKAAKIMWPRPPERQLLGRSGLVSHKVSIQTKRNFRDATARQISSHTARNREMKRE